MALSKITNASIADTAVHGRRNLVINGAMEVAQRGTSSTTSGYGSVDRFQGAYSGGTITHSQEDLTSGAPHDLGFHKFMRLTNTTAGSNAATDYAAFYYYTESQDMRTCGWDYVNPNSYLTFSFWARSSVAGTYYTQIINNDPSEQYNHSFTLAADTWTKVEKKLPGYSSLVFNDDTGAGLLLAVLPYYGTDYTASSVNADEWYDYAVGTQAPDFAQNWRSTSSATFDITGYQLEVGEVSPFEHRSYGEELSLCQRYYYQYDDTVEGGGRSASHASLDSIAGIYHCFPVTMRTDPTLTLLGTSYRTGASSNAERLRPQHFAWGRKKTGGSTGDAVAFATGGFKVEAEL